jgi:cellulose synthase/poly-beta-1,6-N-acetylglucosamine synthase-like glycosyltransferase/peptidoglycan/xylan/chitin deacetylase (PgdA/CDA1 family)/spore germination protein YaaH
MDNNQPKPIFYDKDKKRWPRVKYLALSVFFLFCLLFGGFILSLLMDSNFRHIPVIPSLYRLLYVKPQTFSHTDNITSESHPQATGLNEHPLKKMAFLPLHDVAAQTSLKQNLAKLDTLFVEGAHLNSPEAEIVEEKPKMIAAIANNIHQKNPKTKVILVLDNAGREMWRENYTSNFLANPLSRQRAIQYELAYLLKNHFDGLNIHFKNLQVQHRNDLVLFMQELASALGPKNLALTLNVYPNHPAYDYKQLANSVNYEVLLAYNEHSTASAAGPVASLLWFRESLKTVLQEIPANKLVVSLANNGYDWNEQNKTAQLLSFTQIMALAKIANAQITLDPATWNPFFHYKEENGTLHQVWFLDAVTFFNQCVLAENFHAYGVSLSRLGSEDPSVWSMFKYSAFNKSLAHTLTDIDPKNSFSSIGQVESDIFIINQGPEMGERQITYNEKLGLITHEIYKKFPVPYLIHGYTIGDRKKIALTFDDGPQEKYTPKILDILQETHTPATFFVIGRNILHNQKILKRAVVEGHDIGNHTYTHANISQISATALSIELASTKRLIETSTGRSTLLFRAPFGVGTLPTMLNEIKPIFSITHSGYYTVGVKIDPQDWTKPGADIIAKRVIEQVHHYDSNVISLHDGGGNRQQTVDALPKIIAALTQEGYQFVSLSQLMNIDRNVLMPVQASSWHLFFSRVNFKLLQVGGYIIPIIYLLGIVIVMLRFLVLALLSVYQKQAAKSQAEAPADNDQFSLAVIVPGYNESYSIYATVLSLLKAKHPKSFEIIVVNDGSTDDTLEILQQNLGDNPLVKILTQENAGKASALNYGISQTHADFVTIIDGDTLIHPDTLIHLMHPLHNPKVGAVAGNVRVINHTNLMAKWQVLEYATGQSLDRRALSVLDAVVVVPGALGCWRRKALLDAGGFTTDTLAEDADMTIKLKKLGYRIAVAKDADAYTQVPETVRGFLRQRFRWMYGTYQVVWKHLDAFFKPRYGTLAFIALPNLFLVHVILPLIAPFTDLVFVFTLLTLGLNLLFGHSFTPDDFFYLKSVALYYLIFTSMDLLTTLLAFVLDGKEKKRYLIWLIPQRFFYKQLIYFVAFQSIIAALQGKKVGWGRMIRKKAMGVSS